MLIWYFSTSNKLVMLLFICLLIKGLFLAFLYLYSKIRDVYMFLMFNIEGDTQFNLSSSLGTIK